MKNAKLTILPFALAAVLGLSGCGGVIGGSAPMEAPMTSATGSAAPDASASASPSPSASASATEKVIVPPATKGVVTDGTSTWMQTTADETDADWDVDMMTMTDSAKAKADKSKLEGAWHATATFLAEQGIDSELRAGGAADNPEVFNKWVEDNASKFVEGAKFVPGEASKGNTLDTEWGIQQDDADLAITYGTASKPRILERDFVLNGIEFNEAGNEVTFSVSVSYTMAYTDATGADKVAEGSSNFVNTVVDEKGEWKVKKNKGTFYPLKTVNADGSKSTLK
jgi:hypothetical protein